MACFDALVGLIVLVVGRTDGTNDFGLDWSSGGHHGPVLFPS
jgi:hypothetical protein